MGLSPTAIATLWWREIIRFRRQPSRWIGALLQPIVFWLLLGGGLSASFRPAGAPDGTDYMTYFYPGILVLALLFTAVFSTISVVEDRREGFLQGVLVAPVARFNIILGQGLGSTALALSQATLLLALAPVAGVQLSPGAGLAAISVLGLLGFSLSNIGLMIAWRIRSTQGFPVIMNLILVPMWLLSGAFFPLTGVPASLEWLMRLNPLTYGMAALRRCLYLGPGSVLETLPGFGLSLAVMVALGAATYFAAVATAKRNPF